jgi:hypothetical protein
MLSEVGNVNGTVWARSVEIDENGKNPTRFFDNRRHFFLTSGGILAQRPWGIDRHA